MKLDPKSIEWAINHLIKFSDTDLFPRPVELEIIANLKEEAVKILSKIDISNIMPGAARRFIVPKDDLSYRVATQLDPLDSIIFTGIIYQFGYLLEQKRRPKNELSVFSYRFAPDKEGRLYDPDFSWNKFWLHCYRKSKDFSYAVILDIADFYNQIYHHTIENQLIEAGFPNQVIKWLLRLFGSITAKVSRGIPIGPHAAHLIAEISLRPVDNSLIARGYNFCRFVDDIIIFVNNETEGKIAIYEIAEILDKQQRLHLQRQKIRILSRSEFQKYCQERIEDRPINDLERQLLNIIKKYSNDNPYAVISLSKIDDNDLRLFSTEVVNKILTDYLEKTEPDYIRLRWFIRRLAQVGHPSAVEFCLNSFERLLPALSEICHYFISVGNNYNTNWYGIGSQLLSILNQPIIKSNEYFQMSILSLFNKKKNLDHIDKLIKLYRNSSPVVRREIVLAALANNCSDWIRELKEQYVSMDPWLKRAFWVACKILPLEERKFFVKSIEKTNPLDELLINWLKMR